MHARGLEWAYNAVQELNRMEIPPLSRYLLNLLLYFLN